MGSEQIDEDLKELDQNLKRLRAEYEQFFQGAMKREPIMLRSKVQKTIIRFANEPPRNSAQKFRFNSLNSKFQVYRQLWGRTIRQIEAGTYRRHRFKMKLHESAAAPTTPSEPAAPVAKRSSVSQLHEALLAARRRTGESCEGLDSAKVDRLVRRQVEAIRAKYGDEAKVRFKVVIEDNKAKVKASVRS